MGVCRSELQGKGGSMGKQVSQIFLKLPPEDTFKNETKEYLGLELRENKNILV